MGAPGACTLGQPGPLDHPELCSHHNEPQAYLQLDKCFIFISMLSNQIAQTLRNNGQIIIPDGSLKSSCEKAILMFSHNESLKTCNSPMSICFFSLLELITYLTHPGYSTVYLFSFNSVFYLFCTSNIQNLIGFFLFSLKHFIKNTQLFVALKNQKYYKKAQGKV